MKLFEPVKLSFEKGESIRLWLVNDSAEDIKGSVAMVFDQGGKDENYEIL